MSTRRSQSSRSHYVIRSARWLRGARVSLLNELNWLNCGNMTKSEYSVDITLSLTAFLVCNSDCMLMDIGLLPHSFRSYLHVFDFHRFCWIDACSGGRLTWNANWARPVINCRDLFLRAMVFAKSKSYKAWQISCRCSCEPRILPKSWVVVGLTFDSAPRRPAILKEKRIQDTTLMRY